LEQEKLKQDQPFVTQTSERSENPGSTNKEIVSHSQCDVTFNTGSPHVLDFDVEKSRTTANDEELNQNSTLACPSESQTNELVKRERLVADEDFKPVMSHERKIHRRNKLQVTQKHLEMTNS